MKGDIKITKAKDNHGGKGDKYRKVDKQRFDDNFDRIFGKKDKSPINLYNPGI